MARTTIGSEWQGQREPVLRRDLAMMRRALIAYSSVLVLIVAYVQATGAWRRGITRRSDDSGVSPA